MLIEKHMHLENQTKEELLHELIDLRRQLVTLQAQVNARQADRAMLAEHHELLALSAAVGTALAGNDSLRTSLQRCAEAVIEHLDIATVGIWTIRPETAVLEMQASAGTYLPFGVQNETISVGQSTIGRIAQDRHPYVTNAALNDARVEEKTWVQQTGMVAFAGYPLLIEDRLVGVMALFASRPLTAGILQALAWGAEVIAMGIDRMAVTDALVRSIAHIVRTNKRLQRQNSEFDTLTYMANHDLQEPLRKLVTFSGLLRKDLGEHLPERAAQDLFFITDAATRMRLLIQNLLELAHVKNATMHCEPIPLESCVDRAMEQLAARIQATQATITRERLPMVWGEPRMLTQLYYQLFSNALKFYRSPAPIIHCTVELQKQRLILGVQDHGIGIAPEYAEQIFTPFTRLHGRSEYGGTGLGLTICQEIVARHGGRMWTESTPGEGAHFRFTLTPDR
jgi:signal transduction histidine kinase/ribosomal protein L29